jgi:integrase
VFKEVINVVRLGYYVVQMKRPSLLPEIPDLVQTIVLFLNMPSGGRYRKPDRRTRGCSYGADMRTALWAQPGEPGETRALVATRCIGPYLPAAVCLGCLPETASSSPPRRQPTVLGSARGVSEGSQRQAAYRPYGSGCGSSATRPMPYACGPFTTRDSSYWRMPLTARRGPGEGSIFRRTGDGRWVAMLSIGPRHDRQRFVRYAPRDDNTRSAGRSLLREMLAEQRAGTLVPGRRTTVGEYLTGWLTDTAARSVRHTTLHGYEVVVRLHIVPRLGHVQLTRLTPGDVDGLLNGLSTSLSPKSIHNVHAVLGSAIEQAMRRGIVGRNVVRLVDPPRVARRERQVPSTDEVRQLLVHARGDRLSALWAMAAATGLRQGELLGLQWSDVDLDARQALVRHELARKDGQYFIAETKSPLSDRAVALPAFVVTELRNHRRRQRQERLAAGGPTDDGLIFTAPTGRPISGSWLTHHFHKLAAEAGLRRYPFHALRHVAASVQVSKNVHPRVIMESLGHSTIRMSMETYAHVPAAAARDAAQLVDEALSVESHPESHGAAG